MSRFQNAMLVIWVVCLVLLGIVAHLANEEIEAQMIEEQKRKNKGR